MKFVVAALAASVVLPINALAQTETWYLLIGGRPVHGAVMEKIPMNTEDECEAAADKIFNSEEKRQNIPGNFNRFDYVCIKGK